MSVVTCNLYFACGPLLFHPLKNGAFHWLINVHERTVKKQSVFYPKIILHASIMDARKNIYIVVPFFLIFFFE